MTQTLVVNDGEFEFTNFDKAVKVLQEEYGYEGFMWEMVVVSVDFEILEGFLSDDGLQACIEED